MRIGAPRGRLGGGAQAGLRLDRDNLSDGLGEVNDVEAVACAELDHAPAQTGE
jgi:hypothetical protein